MSRRRRGGATLAAMAGRRFERYVALGDSSTEGLDDPDGRGGYRGWADRLAERIAGGQVFSAGHALGSGFSANVLVAKDANTGIALQPLSVSAENGLSISVAAASLTLQPSGPPKH